MIAMSMATASEERLSHDSIESIRPVRVDGESGLASCTEYLQLLHHHDW